jgi:hypothetical protein
LGASEVGSQALAGGELRLGDEALAVLVLSAAQPGKRTFCAARAAAARRRSDFFTAFDIYNPTRN